MASGDYVKKSTLWVLFLTFEVIMLSVSNVRIANGSDRIQVFDSWAWGVNEVLTFRGDRWILTWDVDFKRDQ